MDYLEIRGGKKLSGSINISGAKNAALPLLALSIIAKNDFEIYRVPEVADIRAFCNMLEMLGAEVYSGQNYRKIHSSSITSTKAEYSVVRKMRASILVLGPLIARFGQCKVSLPGGCAIGPRPVDMHLKAMKELGAEIKMQEGYILAKAKKGLVGRDIIFDKITVTGTSNIIIAAAMAKGKTKIINAAREPEVVQICDVLKDSGIDISGIGTSEIEIYGSEGELIELNPVEVIPDRIEAGTYLCAGAITNSSITLRQVNASHIESVVSKLRDIGFGIEHEKGEGISSVTIVSGTARLCPFEISTQEYPGFPTDMQAQFMALSTQCSGASFIIERLFENRFMHVSELQRLGAKISIDGNAAQIHGKTNLVGADVMATDLRASSALVLSALIAKGVTRIHRIYHLDRGYETLEKKLSALGADVKRLQE